MPHHHDDEHKLHQHSHGKGCGHTAIRHGSHVDYLHDGHLHHVKGLRSVTEHALEISEENPDVCKHLHCAHTRGHERNAEKVPHGDHFDYLVDGRLHHVHDGHCDDHGKIQLA